MSRPAHTLLLIDALNLIRRVYAAQPGKDGPERVTGARAATVQSLERALRETVPTHAACVFDSEASGATWRHELYPDYKAGRAAMPEALASGLEDFRRTFREMGVESLSVPTFEADDLIATAATKAAGAGVPTVILSTDKSYLQLLPAGVRVRDHFRRIDFSSDYVTERFGVRPEQFVDFLALAGDRGNGVPGVPGIGPKTAADLLSRFETLDQLLAALDSPATDSTALPKGKLGERLRENADTVRLCRRLVELRTDLELGINLSELRYQPPAFIEGDRHP